MTCDVPSLSTLTSNTQMFCLSWLVFSSFPMKAFWSKYHYLGRRVTYVCVNMAVCDIYVLVIVFSASVIIIMLLCILPAGHCFWLLCGGRILWDFCTMGQVRVTPVLSRQGFFFFFVRLIEQEIMIIFGW